MWQDYFEVVGIVPGPVFVPGFGTIDLSDKTIPLEFVKEAKKFGCTYLKVKEKKQKTVDDQASK